MRAALRVSDAAAKARHACATAWLESTVLELSNDGVKVCASHPYFEVPNFFLVSIRLYFLN
jgi:hypothetical protein